MAERLGISIAGEEVSIMAQETDFDDKRRPAILLLHGSGGHVDFWAARLGPLLTHARIGLYAPHYFESTGTVRADLATITDGYHVPRWLETIDAALYLVASRPTVDPQRIVLAGVSLGAFLGLALASQLSARPDAVAAHRIHALIDVSGGLVAPYDVSATKAMPPTLILHGEADPIVDVRFARELAQRLGQLGVPYQQEILAGEGHWFSPAALPRILATLSGFLQQQLGL